MTHLTPYTYIFVSNGVLYYKICFNEPLFGWCDNFKCLVFMTIVASNFCHVNQKERNEINIMLQVALWDKNNSTGNYVK